MTIGCRRLRVLQAVWRYAAMAYQGKARREACYGLFSISMASRMTSIVVIQLMKERPYCRFLILYSKSKYFSSPQSLGTTSLS